MDYTGLTPEKTKQIFEKSRNAFDKLTEYNVSYYEERKYLSEIEYLNDGIEKYKKTMNRFKIFGKIFRYEKQIAEWEQKIEKLNDEHALFCQAKNNNQIYDFCLNHNLLDDMYLCERKAMLLAKILKEDKIQSIYLDAIESDDTGELVIEYLSDKETGEMRKIVFSVSCRRTTKESYFRTNYDYICFLYNPNN